LKKLYFHFLNRNMGCGKTVAAQNNYVSAPVDEEVDEKAMREFTIKNYKGGEYIIDVVEEGTVEDLYEALQEALDQSKSIGELLYGGKAPIKSRLLSELDDTTKFVVIEKQRLQCLLTAEEEEAAKSLNIPQDDAEFMKSIFLGFDLNDDGTASLEELKDILRGLWRGKEPSAAEVSAFAFFLGDTSGNLSITFKDFLKMNRIVGDDSEDIAGVFKLFDMFDSKSDQVLSAAEFNDLLDLVYEQTGDSAVKDAFKEMDTSKDRRISITEFIEGLKQAGIRGQDHA